MVNSNLPDGWTFQSLDSVVGDKNLFVDGDWVESKDQDPNGDVRLIQLADIGDGFYRNRSDRFLTYKRAVELGCTFLKKGDLLVARMPDPLGRACIFPGDVKKAVTVVDVCVIRTTQSTHRWLMHAINSPQFRADVESLQSGSTRKRISRKNLEKIYLPVPPLPEQERIVAKIEELFTQLDAGIAALHRVKAEVKRYKASVLKAAVEGKLGIQNDEGRTQDDGQLPAGWTEVEFKEIITSLKNGYFYGRPSSEPIGIPILRISAVRPMSVSYSDLRYVPELKEEDVENYFLSKGDLLFTRYNGNLDLVGACGLVREGSQRVIYPDKLIRVRVQNEIAMPEYLEIYFSTIAARKLIESRVKSTAGQHGISGGDIKSLSVILPPLEEQRRIVAEVERRLSLAAGVESTLAASLSRAGRLRQSVLKSAFEGKLLS